MGFKREVELVVISDVHIGTTGCHANELLKYLKSIRPGTIVLNGDIIDGWQFRKRYFPKSHLKVIKHMISGSENEINPGFPIQFKAKGLGFAFGRNGGIDVIQTLRKADFIQLWKEIRTVPVEDYDLVINDFEPVTARACKLKKVPCIGLSHQGSLLSDKVPRPRTRDWKGPLIIRYYAPVNIHFGFHFLAYDGNIFTPVIRSAVRNHVVEDGGHYTVYLPAWDDQFLIRFLEQFEGIRWQVFSKRAKKSYQHGHLSIFPVSGSAFTRSMASSTGVLCGAGFETPAEALFLGKKLLVLPMKGQYEQHCNAQALAA